MADSKLADLTAVTSFAGDELVYVVDDPAGTPVDRKAALRELLRLEANNQTGTTYTLALTDAGKVVEANNAAAITLTVPPNSSVAFPIGTVVEVFQMGAGQVTVTAGAGVTLRVPNGAKTAKQYAVASLWKRDTDIWVVSGDTTT
jgi:hypothetical protein